MGAQTEHPALETLFRPRAVAVVGASADPAKAGHAIVANLVACGYPGAILPVNPRHAQVLGLPAYPDVSAAAAAARAMGTRLDLAVVAVPADVVADVVAAAGRAGVPYAAVITAGFGETGRAGARREAALLRRARRAGIRLVGPNSLGLVDTATPLNTLFTSGRPPAGPVAFISQSGALWAAVLDWAPGRGVGFSRVVSLGNNVDLDESDFLEAAAADPATRVICLYLEGVRDGVRFAAALRRATREKPVVVLKAGAGRAGARAAASHTGALAGSDRAFRVALRQAGAIQAESAEELFDLAVVLSARPLPAGDRVAVLTNGGGPGILATDEAERGGLRLARLAPATVSALRAGLPPAAAVENPVDLLADADAHRYAFALERLGADPGVEALAVVVLPGARADPEAVARALVAWRQAYPDLPVAAAFTGGASMERGAALLAEAAIPCFPSPERAVRALAGAAGYARRRALPTCRAWTFPDVRRDLAAAALAAARAAGRRSLVGGDAARVAAAYRIPVAPTIAAASADAAVAGAEVLGYPVVLKLAAPDVLHKSDVGGVVLGLDGPDAVREGFGRLAARFPAVTQPGSGWAAEVQTQAPAGRECIAGVVRDAGFGPLVMVGMGGVYAELLDDASFRLADGLRREDVREMLGETRAGRLLGRFRGRPAADRGAVAEVVGRLAQLARDFPDIAAVDLNPLLVYERGVLAVDVKILLTRPRRARARGAGRPAEPRRPTSVAARQGSPS